MRSEIIESAARAFYVDWWAMNEEEHGRSAGGPGEDIMDNAPRTPKRALAFGKKFVAAIERANGEKIDSLYRRAEKAALAPGGMRYARQKPSPHLFGHNLAMSAMGHGVGWTDDYPEVGIVVPDAQWYGGTGEISTRFNRVRA